ncbi:MAG: hypothetical protein ACT4OF_07710 [Caulobacteraceae bacterium]
MDKDFAAMRARVYEFADGGGCAGWGDIARALRREGFEDRDVKRLERDTLLQLMLRRRIERARERHTRTPEVLMMPGLAFPDAAVQGLWWEWEAEGDLHEPVLVVETTYLTRDAARHLDAHALQQLVDAARAHVARLGFAVGTVRLVPARR